MSLSGSCVIGVFKDMFAVMIPDQKADLTIQTFSRGDLVYIKTGFKKKFMQFRP